MCCLLCVNVVWGWDCDGVDVVICICVGFVVVGCVVVVGWGDFVIDGGDDFFCCGCCFVIGIVLVDMLVRYLCDFLLFFVL